MPYRSDYDPIAEFQSEFDSGEGYSPFGRDEPRRPSYEAENFAERARLYGSPAHAGVYWMDHEGEKAGVPIADSRSGTRAEGLSTSAGSLTMMEAVERFSGRAVETMPTPGRRLQTRADLGPGRPAEWTWVPPDPSRPLLAPGEQERSFAEIKRACEAGKVELRYRHPDDPLQSRCVSIREVSSENLDVLKSELVIDDRRFPALLVPTEAKPELSSVKRPPTGRGGRPRKYDWEGFHIELTRIGLTEGELPERHELHRRMVGWCAENWLEQPEESEIRKRLARLYDTPGIVP